ncbi:MAG: hypothetical protein EXX96DRAFT_581112 [Benjaminiella poitrasii]|nr:MAG: hypothetical protein EXX96DRAFT_581112 [Benjaminiella poitrasii]
MAGKGVVRSIKNIAKGFSDVQIKVREATSNDPWGPSGTLMNEIAQYTYNESDFIEIMDMIDKRLNDKGKNWRHVFKALLLLDYCLHVGSENVVLYARENVYVVKTLKEFQHVDESGKDVGANVRQKAKDITNLLQDENRLKEERRQRQGMRDRMANVGDYYKAQTSSRRPFEEEEDYKAPSSWSSRNNNKDEDDKDLKRVLEESKKSAEEEKRHRQEQEDLEKAIQLSKQEEEQKTKSLKETTSNNPYPQLQLDWVTQHNFQQNNMNNTSNPYYNYQQTSAPSSSSQNPYLMNDPLQAQMTGFFPSNNNGALTPQYNNTTTNTNYFLSQPAITTPQQQPSPILYNYSTTTTSSNPFSQLNMTTTNAAQSFTTATEQHPPYDYSGLVFGNPNPTPPISTPSPFPISTATTITNYSLPTNAPNFFSDMTTTTTTTTTGTANIPDFFNNNANSPNITAKQQQQQLSTATTTNSSDLKYAKLNALLANKDDGMDTFGNQGNLRIPYGTGFAGSISIQQEKA